MAYSLLFVSKTLLEFPAGEAELAEMVAGAVLRNASLNITGALISTGIYFAQLLEGEQDAVEELMGIIYEDARHMRVKVIRTAEETRRFPARPMAYTGQASFVDRHIAPLFSSLPARDVAHLASRLVAMMEEFNRLPLA